MPFSFRGKHSCGFLRFEKKECRPFFLVPLLIYTGLHKTAAALPWPGATVSQTTESRYGEIAVVKLGEQSSIYSNGHLLFTYPDAQVEELNAHIPMSLHPSPANVLVIGGSPGILKELLKYPADRIDFVELDPKISGISSKLLIDKGDIYAIKDKRVSIINEDGRRFIKRIKKPLYDLILLNLPQPSTAGINRFYTNDFFKEAKAVLREKGILALTAHSSTGYMGTSMKMVNGSVFNSLRSVFRFVVVTSQEYGRFFASDSDIDTNPEILEGRFARRGIHTMHFSPYLFRDVFSPFGVEYVRKRLGEVLLINTDLRPSAYLYNLMLWTETHGGKALQHILGIREWHIISALALSLLFIASLAFRRKKRIIFYSVFTTGFSGMSFMLAVILAYQSLYGYVYEMIGILSATFMIGLWLGTVMTGHVKTPLKIMFILEVITVVVALASSLFFRAEPLFYLLGLVSGIITGGLFSTANSSLGEPEEAGRLYGLDLMGSFLGALIPAIILIPLFGIYNAILVVALLKSFSALMILSIKQQGA